MPEAMPMDARNDRRDDVGCHPSPTTPQTCDLLCAVVVARRPSSIRWLVSRELACVQHAIHRQRQPVWAQAGLSLHPPPRSAASPASPADQPKISTPALGTVDTANCAYSHAAQHLAVDGRRLPARPSQPVAPIQPIPSCLSSTHSANSRRPAHAAHSQGPAAFADALTGAQHTPSATTKATGPHGLPCALCSPRLSRSALLACGLPASERAAENPVLQHRRREPRSSLSRSPPPHAFSNSTPEQLCCARRPFVEALGQYSRSFAPSLSVSFSLCLSLSLSRAALAGPRPSVFRARLSLAGWLARAALASKSHPNHLCLQTSASPLRCAKKASRWPCIVFCLLHRRRSVFLPGSAAISISSSARPAADERNDFTTAPPTTTTTFPPRPGSRFPPADERGVSVLFYCCCILFFQAGCRRFLSLRVLIAPQKHFRRCSSGFTTATTEFLGPLCFTKQPYHHGTAAKSTREATQQVKAVVLLLLLALSPAARALLPRWACLPTCLAASRWPRCAAFASSTGFASNYITRQLSSLRLRAQILQPTVVDPPLPVSALSLLGYLVPRLENRPSREPLRAGTALFLSTSFNTVKLELPSISSVHARGPVDTWYNSQYAPRPAPSSERLPALPQLQPQTSGSSTSSSPRGGSFSAGSIANGSVSSNTSYSSSTHGHAGYKTPSPEQTPQALNRDGQPLNAQSQQGSPYGNQQSYGYPPEGYNSMNQMQTYPEVHPAHMSAATAHAPASGPPSNMSHYAYPQQPSILQPGPQYAPAPAGYPAPYGYNGVPSQLPASSSMNQSLVPQPIQLPAMSSGAPSANLSGNQNYQHTFDTTGQIAPPGMKPRVTATLWEDEGSLCFQVEAKSVCVARREDNHMINGTKLLNVAGMTRGRRDGILKSEKTRHVVKIGPMHLKGVWIPFDRALEFANKEKITEQLYPLFVHDIGALLYHPSNQSRASVGGAAMATRRPDPMQTQRYLTGPTTSQPPSMHHHHSMSTPIGAGNSQPPHAIQPHPSSGRPSLDRAHTFPTPPTSASSIMGMTNQGSSYEWSASNVQNIPGNQPLSIDTGLSNTRSVPTTPASTPPGSVQPGMSYPTPQGYDASRQMYSAPPSQPPQYHSQPQQMMGYRPPVQDGSYPKAEMAPPARAGDPGDVKPAEGMLSQNNEQGNHAPGEDEGDHDNENEYTHSNATYSSNRSSYPYNANQAQGPIHAEHPHLSPEMTGSPHQNGSGRATPRTTATNQTQWNSGYPTPQRQAPSSNLYSVMDNRAATNGNAPPESYQNPGTVAQYPSQAYAPTNGVPASAKRGRDEDEQDPYGRPDSVAGDDVDGIKRRKTMEGGAVGGAVYNRDPNAGLQRSRTGITTQRARR
ncbi:hypothetical protein P154DRAFT_575048 [Amniculicola lignicola CBS 123094]|uniref:HTH APSES-type domain-containing protein n=1 Tax=Amniculicola lignicola CBS 123094 TaxID=1392246 RepID=A0A6A5WHM2_9PLEO|nr:hypothetical protein P154DRAFT_575048 [Amniculicola lignicola CBS 123094]